MSHFTPVIHFALAEFQLDYLSISKYVFIYSSFIFNFIEFFLEIISENKNLFQKKLSFFENDKIFLNLACKKF